MNLEILENYKNFPKAGNADDASVRLRQLSEIVQKIDAQQEKKFVLHLLETPEGKAFLESIFGNSPYLARLVLKHLDFVREVFESNLDDSFSILIESIKKADLSRLTREDLENKLRVSRTKCALLVAIADITRKWELKKVTESLSEFADEVIKLTIDHLLLEAAKKNLINISNKKNPSTGSGLILLALGKLGSKELNYSSDIDLIVLYDDKASNYSGQQPIGKFYIKIAQDLCSILQNRTEDGYVFRVDLRLRPDPGSMPLAISVSTAQKYYENVGQNWERAAMIKARPIAGDIECGKEFMKFLSRYIWRKYLDFASIQDIHSIKRQIDSKVGELPHNLYGYNIKLGHGGIREIEFFVQTQQLIWGGKNNKLQSPATVDTLENLLELERIDQETFSDLKSAYKLYRNIEHRLQMIDDQQTHTLPDTKEKLHQVAIFVGFESTEKFVTRLENTILLVKNHYSKLFEHSPPLSIDGSLVFTGVENDPETLITIKKLGYADPAFVSSAIRSWHHGKRRATRTKKSREILTEIVPTLLKAIAKTTNPDTAFRRFDEFLGKLPAGVQFFPICFANPELLDLVAEIMGGYPYLAENLSRKPHLLEYVLSEEFFTALPPKEQLTKDLKEYLKGPHDYEDILNLTRIWLHNKQFRVGIQIIQKRISFVDSRRHLSNLADVILMELLIHVKDYFIEQQGEQKDSEFAVVAMGKLGSHELTFGSDIDLVFVYLEQPGNEKQDISANEYFARLSKRFISAVNSITKEGRLYEVDTRIRPSGNDGPIASKMGSYERYYLDSAWNWEKMALLSSRIVCGSGKKIQKRRADLIAKILEQHYDKKTLCKEIVEMRNRVGKKYVTNNPFNVKYISGGLIDIEYIVRYIQLTVENSGATSTSSGIQQAIKDIEAVGAISKQNSKALIGAYSLYQDLQSFLRLLGNENLCEEQMTGAIKNNIAEALNNRNFQELKKNLVNSQKKVQKIYKYSISDTA